MASKLSHEELCVICWRDGKCLGSGEIQYYMLSSPDGESITVSAMIILDSGSYVCMPAEMAELG